jgi:type II secretory pathway component PulC
MHVKYKSQQSIEKETVHNLVLITILISSMLFFVDTVDAQVAAPGYRLMGTVEGKTFKGAVLADSTGVQSFYSLNEKLPDGSQLVKVRSDSILLRGADGTSYDVYISQDAKTVASIKPVVPADPYAPGTIRNTDAEQHNSQARYRGRRSRSQSSEE